MFDLRRHNKDLTFNRTNLLYMYVCTIPGDGRIEGESGKGGRGRMVRRE